MSPPSPVYKNKSQAQDAHEAIRPTTCDLAPEAVKPYLKREEFSLYQLVWNRFLASQMSPALSKKRFSRLTPPVIASSPRARS